LNRISILVHVAIRKPGDDVRVAEAPFGGVAERLRSPTGIGRRGDYISPRAAIDVGSPVPITR